MCSNEDHGTSGPGELVPGHEEDCACYICEAARSVPDAIVPDDFTIHRHRQHPLYIVEFRRLSDDDEDHVGVRVILQPHMLDKIGTLMIENAMHDVAALMDGDDWETV